MRVSFVPLLVLRYHTLSREQHLPGSPSDVFAFFSDAGNLEAITPPWLRFEIVTPRPIPMQRRTISRR